MVIIEGYVATDKTMHNVKEVYVFTRVGVFLSYRLVGSGITEQIGYLGVILS